MQLQLRRLRLRLAAWYVGSFAAILLVVGFGMYWVTAREVEAQLGRSPAPHRRGGARRQVAEKGRRRGRRSGGAVEVIEVPGSNLYLFDRPGGVLTPGPPRARLRQAAADALRYGAGRGGSRDGGRESWRLHARRFSLSDGHTYVGGRSRTWLQVEAHRCG